MPKFVKRTPWQKGIKHNENAPPPFLIKGWMRTEDKADYKDLARYHRAARRYYGTSYMVRSYEYQGHYAHYAKRC